MHLLAAVKYGRLESIISVKNFFSHLFLFMDARSAVGVAWKLGLIVTWFFSFPAFCCVKITFLVFLDMDLCSKLELDIRILIGYGSVACNSFGCGGMLFLR